MDENGRAYKTGNVKGKSTNLAGRGDSTAVGPMVGHTKIVDHLHVPRSGLVRGNVMVPLEKSVICEETECAPNVEHKQGGTSTKTTDPPKKDVTVSNALSIDKEEVTDKSTLSYEKVGNSVDKVVHKEVTSVREV